LSQQNTVPPPPDYETILTVNDEAIWAFILSQWDEAGITIGISQQEICDAKCELC
jgi:hypothetical protein